MMKKVWAQNFQAEILAVDRCLSRFPMVAFDTEFPGCLRSTPRHAPETTHYLDLKFNIDTLKPLQLGLTLFDTSGNIGGTWEFNLRGFDEKADPHAADSVAFLKHHGLNFEELFEFGIDVDDFTSGLNELLRMHRGHLQWVSFHGLYDSAYVLKLVTRRPLPSSLTEFAKIAARVFGTVYDVKFMARYCGGLLCGGEIGLERMAGILGVDRCGGAHQAGSDSLLTAQVFLKMRALFGLKPGMYEGFLYGLSPKISCVHPVIVVCGPTRPRTTILVRCPTRPIPTYGYGFVAAPAMSPIIPLPLHPVCNPFPAALPQGPQYHIHM